MKIFILGTGHFSIFRKLLSYNSEIIIFNSVHSLVDRLEAVGPNQSWNRPPDMILAALEILNDDHEADIQKLSFYTKNHKIPCFALTSEINEHTKAKAASVGCNDIYRYDDNVVKLIDRMTFLKKTLKETTNQHGSVEEGIKLKMPILKRSFDIMFSLIVLVVLSPLIVLIALAIKLESKGPVFYVAKRVGAGYKVFDFYKFRTMKHGSDHELETLLSLNQYGPGKSTFIKINNDPRVTKVGSFLRKISIDELPQFINVLKGEMSIVGNRPLPLYEAEILTDDKSARRFMAPAGITGLWQVSCRGKGKLSEAERKELDVRYATHWDVWVDFKILLKTIPALIQREAV